jgi:hypothetical protein
MESNPLISLIADDNEFFRIALRTILTRELEFQQVIETGTLDDAIEQLSNRNDISLACLIWPYQAWKAQQTSRRYVSSIPR